MNFNKLLLLFIFLASGFHLQAQDKKVVVATASMIADMAEIIGGDIVQVECIVPIGGDPHLYDPTPKDANLLNHADLVFKNGLTFEGWLNELIATSGTKANVITVTDGVEAIRSLEYQNATDPHAWMDARNALFYIKNIKEGLVNLLPEHSEAFEKNYLKYKEELVELDRYIREQIAKIPEQKRVLITSHDAFQYYGRAYGITLESVLGTSTDAEAQTSDILRLNKVIKESGVPAIFVETTINPKMLKQVAKDNDIIIGGSLYADSIGDEESPAPTYAAMMRFNTDAIVNALTRTKVAANEGNHEHDQTETSLFAKVILFGIIGGLFLGGFFLMLNTLNKTARSEKVGNTNAPIIEVKGLSVSYDRKRVLTNIYLKIERGQIYGVVGPNGAGKSTLFKAILGLIETNSGTILIEGSPIEAQRKRVVYVPQKTDVDWNFPATVLDVVLMGRYPHKTTFQNLNEKDKRMALEALEEVGIANFKDRQIGELSGGQQQRVFIARALCQEADVFLLDEPFVGVDMTTEEKIVQILKKLADQGKTLLVVHHDLSSVQTYFDQVILLNQRLIACGDTEVTFTQENLSKAYGGQLPILHQTGMIDS